MSTREYEILKNGELDKLGHAFYKLNLSNNHKYKKDVKYLHFFKNKNSINKYFLSVPNCADENFVICTFNIPLTKLIFHASIGKYQPSGYDEDYSTEIEFALPFQDFKIEYFIKAESVTNFKNEQDEPVM